MEVRTPNADMNEHFLKLLHLSEKLKKNKGKEIKIGYNCPMKELCIVSAIVNNCSFS